MGGEVGEVGQEGGGGGGGYGGAGDDGFVLDGGEEAALGGRGYEASEGRFELLGSCGGLAVDGS